MRDMDGLCDLAFDTQGHAAAHEGCVERQSRVVAAGDLTKPVTWVFGEEREQFIDRDARIVSVGIAPGRFIAAVDDHDRVSLNAGQYGRDSAFRLCAGRTRQRLGLAHQRAQIGIFPFLDTPVRQSAYVETLERFVAQPYDRALARQPIARRRIGSSEPLFGRGLDGAHVRRHHAASSENCA